MTNQPAHSEDEDAEGVVETYSLPDDERPEDAAGEEYPGDEVADDATDQNTRGLRDG